MKNKTALKQSKVAVQTYAALSWVFGLLLIMFPSLVLAVFFGLATLHFLGDFYNIVYISRRAREDEAYLESRAD